MEHLALPLALALLGASDAPPAVPQSTDDEPRATMRELRPDFRTGNRCRDNNLPAVDIARHQPRLERGPATADMGQVIYAVERRIDGCSVVLVKSQTVVPSPPHGHFRPSPEQEAALSGKR